MTEVLLLVAIGLTIGLVLGGLGGGGAILTVPALVFLVGQGPAEATGGSLVIVGLAAVAGVGSHVRAGTVSWRTGLTFGVAGVPAAYVGSRLSAAIDPDRLLLAFAVLMVVVAVAMLRPGPSRDRMAAARAQKSENGAGAASGAGAAKGATQAVAERTDARHASWPVIIGAGLGVGLLTGFFGVGGGFVIVPALTLLLRLPMRLAVGTSLIVVAINSAAALLSRLGHTELDWAVIGPVAAAAMLATFVGRRLAVRLPAARLKRAFAVLLVLVAGYTGVKAAIGLAGASSAAALAQNLFT